MRRIFHPNEVVVHADSSQVTRLAPRPRIHTRRNIELPLEGMVEDGLPIPEPTSEVEYVEVATPIQSLNRTRRTRLAFSES